MAKTMYKSEVAMMRVMLRAAEKNLLISRPVVDCGRYDFVLDEGGKLYRVQVKYANGTTSREGSTFVRLSPGGVQKRQVKPYCPSDIDLLMVFVPAKNKVYKLPPKVWQNKFAVTLRHSPSRNGQRKGCIDSSLYEW